MSKQKPTMKEIAALAGVSKSTVSRALAGDPRINEDTRARIQKIAQELNYKPNTMATGLAKQRTHTLGLVIPMAPRSVSDPFYLEFVGGVGDYAITREYSLLLSPLYPSKNDVPGHILMTELNRVDGLILTEPLLNDERLAYLRKQRLPFVFLGNSGSDPDLLWVNGDNTGGARQATEHLIARGHQSIACIAGPTRLVHGRDRLEGYRQALKNAGLPITEELIVTSDFTEQGGYLAMRGLLDQSLSFSAVFACNDLMAIGALRALHEKGLQVPDDVAVVGFDGIRMGEYTSPPLTTVAQPIYQMGYFAAEMLIKTILGEPVPQTKLTLPLKLIVRGSSA